MIRRVFWALVIAHLGASGARAQQELPIRRVALGRLEIPSAGVAVIRTRAQWEMLWRRYSSGAWSGVTGERIHPEIPVVDFRREMVVIVSFGPASGCSNTTRWVTRVIERRDSVTVRLRPLPTEPVLTCMMIIHPADLVLLPRRDKPVAFHGSPRVPAPANWLRTPPDAALDALPDHGEHILAGQVLDPATSPQRVAWLVDWAARRGNANVGELLLDRPEVRGNPRFVARLVGLPDRHGERARDILVRDFAAAVAADPRAPTAALRALIEAMSEPQTDPRVAALLIQNPAVRRDREQLRAYARHAQRNVELWREACRVYLARWPGWERTQGSPANDPSYYAAIICPEPPPFPPPPDGGARP